MTWRIPPLGWCATCLAAFQRERPAATLFKGTSLCQEHLDAVLEPEVAAAMREAEADDKGEQ